MMKPGHTMTMTNDIQRLSAPDASMNNEVINLPGLKNRDGCVLSVISWLAIGDIYSSLFRVYDYVIKEFKSIFSEVDIWLFIGSSGVQPDTRIVRYRKLWAALRLRGVEVAYGSDYKEVVQEGEGGISFFGAVRLSELSLESSVHAILKENCSYIVILPKGTEVEATLSMGWTGQLSEDLDFVCCVARLNGFVLKKIGAFDDNEWGCFCVGPVELARRLVN